MSNALEQSRKAKKLEQAISSLDSIDKDHLTIIRDVFLLGRDRDAITMLIDEFKLDEDGATLRKHVLPVRSRGMVSGGNTVSVIARPQVPFKPWHFQISETCYRHFDILNITIGNVSQMISVGDIEGKRFLEPYPLKNGDQCRVAIDLTVTARNKTEREGFEFIGYFVGEWMESDY